MLHPVALTAIPVLRLVFHSGKWVEWRPLWMCGKDLHHSTVGIVGLGRIGTAVARRLCYGFDCKLLYCGPREKPEAANLFSAEYVSFEDLLNRVLYIRMAFLCKTLVSDRFVGLASCCRSPISWSACVR